MTAAEFKAWLEGFEQSMGDKPPTAEQWKTIKSKVSQISVETRRRTMNDWVMDGHPI